MPESAVASSRSSGSRTRARNVRKTYSDIKLALRARIEDGGWQPGMKLPSERALVQEFGCARMTVHRALRELQDEGLIARRHGSGSYVADLRPISNILNVRDIHDEVAERGRRHSSRLLYARRTRADPEVAAAMRIAAGTSVFSCGLIHFENDVPIQLEERFVNPRLVPDFLDLDLEAKTPSSYLFERAPLTEAEQVVEAVNADERTARLLQLHTGAALLRVSRRTVSRGVVASIAHLYHPGAHFRLVGQFSVAESVAATG